MNTAVVMLQPVMVQVFMRKGLLLIALGCLTAWPLLIRDGGFVVVDGEVSDECD